MYLNNNMNTQTQIELWAEFFQLEGIKTLECLEVFTMMFSAVMITFRALLTISYPGA